MPTMYDAVVSWNVVKCSFRNGGVRVGMAEEENRVSRSHALYFLFYGLSFVTESQVVIAKRPAEASPNDRSASDHRPIRPLARDGSNPTARIRSRCR
ncbi:hypothetical protein B296_00043836 [Ensete ventricosum]|uniref:Uncharacterized protein n=1 Tax=Ensete ventricosum TaxID=4639 RepID=A0A426Y4L6_ENSVE|nr:hypothetical protein B296_00043836 [Ensete ventricosum]